MKSVTMILLFVPVALWGQMKERVSIRMNYNHVYHIEKFEKLCTNEFDVHYPFQIPTFLGNHKSFDLDLAIRINPEQTPFSYEIILRRSAMTFTGGDYYKNLKCTILAPGAGISYKYPVLNNLFAAGYLNFLMGVARISREENNYKIYYNELVYSIRQESIDKIFLMPVIEPGLEIEYQVTTLFALQTRIGLALSSYPDFETDSPLFYKSLLLSAGLKYIIKRNKTIGY